MNYSSTHNVDETQKHNDGGGLVAKSCPTM